MEKKTKIVALVALMVVALATGIYLDLPTVYAEAIPKGNGQYTIRLQYRRWAWPGLRFLKNGVQETLTGKAVTLGNLILVLDVGGKCVNVILPSKWVVDGQVVSTKDLFDGEPLSVGQGQTISLRTLKLELLKETYAVRGYVAYEIQTGSVIIKALLPVNIETG